MSDNNASNSWNLNLTNTKFNLVTKPWIPVIYTDGNIDTVSLETFFINADKIMELYSVDTYVEVAIFNLLLSIRDVAYAHKGRITSGYDSNIIRDYFGKRVEWNNDLTVADLFDLYDPKHPFLQVPWDSDLLRKKTKKDKKTGKVTEMINDEKDLYQLYLPLNTDNKTQMWAKPKNMTDGTIACLLLGLRLYHLVAPSGAGDCAKIECGTHSENFCPFYKVSKSFDKFFEINFDVNDVVVNLPWWEQNTDDIKPEWDVSEDTLQSDDSNSDKIDNTYDKAETDTENTESTKSTKRTEKKKTPVYKKVKCVDVLMARMYSNLLISINIKERKFRVGANSPLDLFNLSRSPYVKTGKNKIDMTKDFVSLVKDKKVILHEGDDFIFITPPKTKNKTAFVKLPEVAHTFHCAIKDMSAFDANKASTTFERVSAITNGFEKHMRKLRCDKVETFVEQAENEVACLLEKGLSSFVCEKDGNIRPNIENKLLKEVKSVYRRTEKDALKLYGTAEMFSLIETCDKDDEDDNGNKLFSKNEYAITDIEAKTPKTWENNVTDDESDNCEITRTPSRVLKSLRDYELIPTVVKDNLKFYVDGNDEFYNLRRFGQSLGLPKDLLYVNDRELIEDGITLAESLFVPVAKSFTQETLANSFYGTKRGFGRLMADISYYLAKENNLEKFEQYNSKYKSCLRRNDVYGLARLMKRMVDVWVSHSEDPTMIPLNFGELAYKFYRALKDDRELNVLALETLDGFGYRVMKKETKTK